MNGNQIVNIYDAAGRKLRTTSYTLTEPLATPATRVLQLAYILGNAKETTTIYNGNIVSSYTLPHKDLIGRPHTYYIYNSEGYVTRFSAHTLKTPRFTWYYYRRDHLGNNVAVWNATADSTLQRTFYYASGLPMSCSTGQSTQRRKYNGKEYVEDHGFDVYDYGFRGYYATIGRFTSIDPLAEQTPWQSPYVYANNNFVNNIDYWGLAAIGNIAGFHTNIPVTTLNWVAIDDDGNVVGWGDDEDDNHVYLVDEYWDGTYAGLGGYEMIGWEIGTRDYALNQPCLYLGFYNIGNINITNEGTQPMLYVMYGNHPATPAQIEQGLGLGWLSTLINEALLVMDDVFSKKQKVFLYGSNFAFQADKFITRQQLTSADVILALLSLSSRTTPLAISVDIYTPLLTEWVQYISTSFQNMFNQHVFDTYGGLPYYYE